MSNLITFDKTQDIRIVRFCFDEINLQQRLEIKDKLRELLANGDRHFVFDFSKTGFLSSLVIATILSFIKESRALNGNVKLCCMSKEASDVLKITKLDKIIESYDTERDAINSFGI